MAKPPVDDPVVISREDLDLLLEYSGEGVAAKRRAGHAIPAAAGRRLAALQRSSMAGSAGGTAVTVPTPQGAGLVVTAPEAAELLDVSESYIRRLCRSGEIGASKRGPAWLLDAAFVAALAQSRRTS